MVLGVGTANLSGEGEASKAGGEVEAGCTRCSWEPGSVKWRREQARMLIHSPPLSLPLESKLHEGRNFVLFTAISPG